MAYACSLSMCEANASCFVFSPWQLLVQDLHMLMVGIGMLFMNQRSELVDNLVQYGQQYYLTSRTCLHPPSIVISPLLLLLVSVLPLIVVW